MLLSAVIWPIILLINFNNYSSYRVFSMTTEYVSIFAHSKMIALITYILSKQITVDDIINYAVAAPHIWNRLPTDVVAANSLSTFLRLLKRFIPAIVS